MTDLISRPPRPRPRRASPSARSATSRPAPVPPVPWAGVLAALRAVGLGLLAVMVPVLLAWATAADSGASADQAVSSGLVVWLVAHAGRVAVPDGTFGLPPLGLTLLAGLLLATSTSRAARTAEVHGRRGVVALTVAVMTTYAMVAAALALLARTGTVTPDPVSAFVGAGFVAGLAGGFGAVRGSRRGPAWWSRLPPQGRVAMRAGGGALALAGGLGSLLTGLMLGHHLATATDLVSSLRGGWSAALLVLLICLAYAPTAAVWGAAYLLGPGFAVGTGTAVAATGVTLGPAPALPLLAALPTGAPAHPWLLPVVAAGGTALVAGLLADRAAAHEALGGAALVSSSRDLLRLAGLTGAVAGVLAATVALLASGPAGPGRLDHTGPTWWLLGLVVAAEVAAGTALVLLVRRRRPVPQEPLRADA